MTLGFRFGASLGGHSVQFRAALGEGLSAFRLRFTGVVFDNTAIPLRPARASCFHLLLYVEEGSIVWADRLLGPGALLLAPEAAVLPSAPGAASLRTGRGPVSLVVARVPSPAVEDPRESVRAIPTGSDLTSAVERVARAIDLEQQPDAPLEVALSELWLSLCACDLVSGAAPAGPSDTRVPGAERRVTEALSLVLSQLEQNPQLVDVIGHARVTERQVLRDLLAVQARFGFVLRGWRDTIHWWRLVAATLFLGAPEPSIGEVAKTVGFTSTTTMARAFKNAGMPQPGVVRAALRS